MPYGRAACGKRIIIASLEHRVQLPPPDAHIAAVEDRQRQRIPAADGANGAS